jgi:5-methylcytosine-specific restriction endonuclease McrA
MKLTREQKKAIRLAIFKRQGGLCLDCGAQLTWEMAHMHEIVPRSKGGAISLNNSIILCYDCHLNGRHGDRRLRFGEFDSRNKT